MADHDDAPARRSAHDLIDLSGRTALINGGTRNIGREIAGLLADVGAAVAVTGRNDRDNLDATVAELEARGVPAFGTLADAREPSQIHRAIDETEQALGDVDIFVNCAAIRPHAPIEDIGLDDWQEVIDTNLRAPFVFGQRLLPGMAERGYGRIVLFGGLSNFWGKPQRPHVSASKMGVVGLTIALASEAATENVTANCVVPGVIDTERHTPGWYPDLDDFYERRRSRIPMARLGESQEVASACLFLVSDLASYMTGQTLFVSGGAFPMVRGA